MDKIVIWFPYIPAMVNNVEKWLLKMSFKGYRLVYMNGWKFIFNIKKAENIEYFIYSGFDASKGWSYDYFRAKDKYGKSGTLINRTNCGVFEVDSNKIDEVFYKYRHSRNRYYLKHYALLFITSLFFLLTTVVLTSYYYSSFIYLTILYFIMFLYSIISFIILYGYMKKK